MTNSPARVQAGSFLTLHYRLGGPSGDIINTFGGKPATLSLGSGALSPAVEQCLMDMAEGERATFDLPAGAAFGERNASMEQWVALKLLRKLGDPQERYAAGPAQSPRHKYLFQINSGIEPPAEITVALVTKYGENGASSKGL